MNMKVLCLGPVPSKWAYLLLASFLSFFPLKSHAATVIRGKVMDATTDTGIAGAVLELSRADQVFAVGTSDSSGHFQLSFDIPGSRQSQALKLISRSDGFVAGSHNVIITSGAPDLNYYSIRLLPSLISRCLLDMPHLVIVGHFRSASPEVSGSDICRDMVDALQYSLLVPLQEVRVPQDFQPVFWACDEAEPRSKLLAGAYARALKAHAFVTGDVERKDANFRVSTYVGDSYNLFVPPLRTINEDVDLRNARGVNPETHAAIFLALAVSYEQSGRYAECVDVILAARKLGEGSTSSALERVIEARLQKCQEKLPNRGLLPGETP